MPTIWIIGDSTVEDNTPPFRGWGWAMPQFAAPGVEVRNHALSGRSSRSFWDEGLFGPVQAGMRPGDLLLIQFGHNDEKPDAERHTDPFTTFQEFLSRYCDAAEAAGALPVLLTPVSRRFFTAEHEMDYTHGDYPEGVRQLAARRGLPLVDLKRLTRELYLALGAEKAAKLFVQLAPGEHPDFPDGHDDKTHFNAHGAQVICRLAARALSRLEPCKAYVSVEGGTPIMNQTPLKGGFTLPGESGKEDLTLQLAETWGADVIRDSDGTKLSERITKAGYGIYSTVCVIREHNEFLEQHPECQQQSFLCTRPRMAEGGELAIPLMADFFDQQFEVNETPQALRYMQVYDRTAGVPVEGWQYANGVVTLTDAQPFHLYTVSFLAWRIWEEINMYNHTTNGWTSPHLRQLDPRHPLAWDYLVKWMERWCEQNPDTTVVRFTSLFYNFVWIWDNEKRNLFTDWASYDFTVSAEALDAFREEYGYALTAEDFVNGGNYQVTHMPPTAHKKDYMAFIQRFVAEKAKVLVDIVHRYGKQAYVFYDDSWVGMEPWGGYFTSIGFDGLIKCVFSGFECRLCAGVDVPTHEIRLHPYLFPVGLGGLPTFSEGGHPEKDAMDYWLHVRRALLRAKIDRIGLGGYLHLTEGYPEFVDAITHMANEFRQIKALHQAGAPAVLPVKIAVVHTWGRLRSWTLSGHFHETYMHTLIHINEALSGMPFDVTYLSFEDVKSGALAGYDVVINAGRAGDAWSGGDAWKDAEVVAAITRFVAEGGVLLGVGEPSAAEGFRLADVLGVNRDTGARVCHGRYPVQACGAMAAECIPDGLSALSGLYLTDPDTQVLACDGDQPLMTLHAFGKGRAVYMTGFAYSPKNCHALLRLLLHLTGLMSAPYTTDCPQAEVAWFPASETLVVINNAEEAVTARVTLPQGVETVALAPLETKMLTV